jgi:hypothetical protein
MYDGEQTEQMLAQRVERPLIDFLCRAALIAQLPAGPGGTRKQKGG